MKCIYSFNDDDYDKYDIINDVIIFAAISLVKRRTLGVASLELWPGQK